MLKLPRTFKPKGRPREGLAYLNAAEMEFLRRVTDGTISRGPKGIPSFRLDDNDIKDIRSGTNTSTSSGTGAGPSRGNSDPRSSGDRTGSGNTGNNPGNANASGYNGGSGSTASNKTGNTSNAGNMTVSRGNESGYGKASPASASPSAGPSLRDDRAGAYNGGYGAGPVQSPVGTAPEYSWSPGNMQTMHRVNKEDRQLVNNIGKSISKSYGVSLGDAIIGGSQMAKTVFGELGNRWSTPANSAAVAQVILNRVGLAANKGHYGGTMKGVLGGFDANGYDQKRVASVGIGPAGNSAFQQAAPGTPQYQSGLDAIEGQLHGTGPELPAPVMHATNYRANTMKAPSWEKKGEATEYGPHTFSNPDEGRPANVVAANNAAIRARRGSNTQIASVATPKVSPHFASLPQTSPEMDTGPSLDATPANFSPQVTPDFSPQATPDYSHQVTPDLSQGYMTPPVQSPVAENATFSPVRHPQFSAPVAPRMKPQGLAGLPVGPSAGLSSMGPYGATQPMQSPQVDAMEPSMDMLEMESQQMDAMQSPQMQPMQSQDLQGEEISSKDQARLPQELNSLQRYGSEGLPPGYGERHFAPRMNPPSGAYFRTTAPTTDANLVEPHKTQIANYWNKQPQPGLAASQWNDPALAQVATAEPGGWGLGKLYEQGKQLVQDNVVDPIQQKIAENGGPVETANKLRMGAALMGYGPQQYPDATDPGGAGGPAQQSGRTGFGFAGQGQPQPKADPQMVRQLLAELETTTDRHRYNQIMQLLAKLDPDAIHYGVKMGV